MPTYCPVLLQASLTYVDQFSVGVSQTPRYL